MENFTLNVPPIYLKMKDLIVILLNIIPNFPKVHRGLGEKIELIAIGALPLLTLAYQNNGKDNEKRNEYLLKFAYEFQQIYTIVEICAETKIMTNKQIEKCAVCLNEIKKQLYSWMK